MPRKPVSDDDIAAIKRELETSLQQGLQLVADMLRQVDELRQKLEALEQRKL